MTAGILRDALTGIDDNQILKIIVDGRTVIIFHIDDDGNRITDVMVNADYVLQTDEDMK